MKKEKKTVLIGNVLRQYSWKERPDATNYILYSNQKLTIYEYTKNNITDIEIKICFDWETSHPEIQLYLNEEGSGDPNVPGNPEDIEFAKQNWEILNTKYGETRNDWDYNETFGFAMNGFYDETPEGRPYDTGNINSKIENIFISGVTTQEFIDRMVLNGILGNTYIIEEQEEYSIETIDEI